MLKNGGVTGGDPYARRPRKIRMCSVDARSEDHPSHP
jgi:hypothetical protein